MAESAPYTRIFLPFQSATVRIGHGGEDLLRRPGVDGEELEALPGQHLGVERPELQAPPSCAPRCCDVVKGSSSGAISSSTSVRYDARTVPDLGAAVEDGGEQLRSGVERGGGMDADLHPAARLLLQLGGEGIVVDGVIVGRRRHRGQVPDDRASPGRPRGRRQGGPARHHREEGQDHAETRELLHRMPLSRQIGSTSFVSTSPSAASAFFR